jgi:hypothetical protein
MSSWRDNILKEFIPNISKLTLVADPDSLLSEEKLSAELRKRGFDLIEFNDSIEFRYAYESKYRSIWDQGLHTDLVVILRVQNSEISKLPYDLLKAGRILSFNLGEIFPNLSYPILDCLDHQVFDELFEAQISTSPGVLGDNGTKDFILRHVYSIAPELIKTEVDLLRSLLKLHYGNIELPEPLSNRLIQLLHNNGTFDEWPLERIIKDTEVFYTFLQERWSIFLDSYGPFDYVSENSPAYGLKIPGPEQLPFDHQDIRVYIDNLFIEGKLTPVDYYNPERIKDSWVACGIKTTIADSANFRKNRLLNIIEENLPSAQSRYKEWIALALQWAELSSLIHNNSDENLLERFTSLQIQINDIFAKWLNQYYASLVNLSPSTPAMVHHIPRFLSRQIEGRETKKIALLVIDGLAFDQWITIKHLLQSQDRTLIFHDSAVFAWIPTLTSVSRQAIFAGKPPIYFPNSIYSTNSEEKLWKQFWQDQGLQKQEVAYRRSLGDEDIRNSLDAVINPYKTIVAGIVIDTVDKIMHGMQLGSPGMHNQIAQWCKTGYLKKTLDYLDELGYEVWLTSDHGNIEAVGTGRVAEGSLADSRGERVRIYPNVELRNQTAAASVSTRPWDPIGLPENFFPLLAENNTAFIKERVTTVAHGGISIEEVIVPLIKIERIPHR